ncbi:putative tail fiber domain protein [Clostridioides difficile CD144]|nr:putative tail fiber domain protein [Clostridioides difficile CD144]
MGFVKIQLGDGGGSEYTPTESQTALKKWYGKAIWKYNYR